METRPVTPLECTSKNCESCAVQGVSTFMAHPSSSTDRAWHLIPNNDPVARTLFPRTYEPFLEDSPIHSSNIPETTSFNAPPVSRQLFQPINPDLDCFLTWADDNENAYETMSLCYNGSEATMYPQHSLHSAPVKGRNVAEIASSFLKSVSRAQASKVIESVAAEMHAAGFAYGHEMAANIIFFNHIQDMRARPRYETHPLTW